MFQTYRLSCRTLTPVHIGTGEVLEPFNYHMQNNTLFVFNLSQFISSAEPKLRGEFLKIIDGNDIVGLRQFIRKHIDLEKYSLFRIKVTPEIAREYEVKKDDIRNQLLINPFIRNETTGICYIPGSSIKGAIRTGVLNYVLRQKDREKIKREIKKEKPKWAAQKAEKLILNYKNPTDDPFRAVKISDAILSENATFVGEVFNYNPSRKRFNSIDMRVEMTEGEICNKSIDFNTEISILRESEISIEMMKNACNQFYKDIAQYEHRKFYKHRPALQEVSIRLLNIIETLPENSFIIRIGRFSHAESMTIEGLRRISVMGKGRRFYRQEEGTTRNLALQKYPMGWCLVEW